MILNYKKNSDLHLFNFKTIIFIEEYLKYSTFKAIEHSVFIGIDKYIIVILNLNPKQVCVFS